MKEWFDAKIREYFPYDHERFIQLMDLEATQGFFLNTRKASRSKILEIIDFPYQESIYTDQSFSHSYSGIGKTKAYELGLIYPQDIAASLTSYHADLGRVSLAVDLCAAPGGKSINILNRCTKDVLLIANDRSHSRALTLSSNLERCGLDNVIITSKDTSILAEQLKGQADLVVLDAPCSGEGMIRKYPEILKDLDQDYIDRLAAIQHDLLHDAYKILAKDGLLIYSTCTFAFEEDEWQVSRFLEEHPDMELTKLDGTSASTLEGTVKMSFLDGTEGQFFAMMVKHGDEAKGKLPLLKQAHNNVAESFIRSELICDMPHLYEHNGRFYISKRELPDLKEGVLRYGTPLGQQLKGRFEPEHGLYRSIVFAQDFRHSYEMDDRQYDLFVSGNTFNVDLPDHYYRLTHKDNPCGFGKCSKGQMKNKYPKGLRRML